MHPSDSPLLRRDSPMHSRDSPLLPRGSPLLPRDAGLRPRDSPPLPQVDAPAPSHSPPSPSHPLPEKSDARPKKDHPGARNRPRLCAQGGERRGRAGKPVPQPLSRGKEVIGMTTIKAKGKGTRATSAGQLIAGIRKGAFRTGSQTLRLEAAAGASPRMRRFGSSSSSSTKTAPRRPLPRRPPGTRCRQKVTRCRLFVAFMNAIEAFHPAHVLQRIPRPLFDSAPSRKRAGAPDAGAEGRGGCQPQGHAGGTRDHERRGGAGDQGERHGASRGDPATPARGRGSGGARPRSRAGPRAWRCRGRSAPQGLSG